MLTNSIKLLTVGINDIFTMDGEHIRVQLVGASIYSELTEDPGYLGKVCGPLEHPTVLLLDTASSSQPLIHPAVAAGVWFGAENSLVTW